MIRRPDLTHPDSGGDSASSGECGVSVTFNCHEGYEFPDGEVSVTVSSNSTGQCHEGYEFPGGGVSVTVSSNSTGQCHEGYEFPDGEVLVTGSSNSTGQWHGTKPTCP